MNACLSVPLYTYSVLKGAIELVSNDVQCVLYDFLHAFVRFPNIYTFIGTFEHFLTYLGIFCVDHVMCSVKSVGCLESEVEITD